MTLLREATEDIALLINREPRSNDYQKERSWYHGFDPAFIYLTGWNGLVPDVSKPRKTICVHEIPILSWISISSGMENLKRRFPREAVIMNVH
jgi:hypothetical protein